MDINSESDSEDEVEVTEQASVEMEQQGQDEEQQTSAAHPTNEETTSLARECGTPGCDLADGHLELCKTQQVTGPRRRPPVSVQTGQAKAAEDSEEAEEVGEVEEEQQQQQQQQQQEEEEEEVRGAARGQTEAAEAAVRQAEAEGLTLQPSNNTTGYRGVARHGGTYQARVSRAGKEVHIGCFATAEEAALAYARTPETQAWARAQATKPAPLTAGEAVAQAADEDEEDKDEGEEMGQTEAAEAAVRQAEAEGLTLQPANNAVGYRGVTRHGGTYQVRISRAGKEVHIGIFPTVEEAALAYARTPEAQARAQAQAKPAPLTAEEVVAQAAAEGLTLETNSQAASGFKGVVSRGYRQVAIVWDGRAGKNVQLGSFRTAEEAALAVARADAHADPPAVSPAAPKRRAAPPAKPPPAKQPRNSLAPRHLQPTALSHAAPAPQQAPMAAAAAAPAPARFKDKLALLKFELGIEPSTPAIPAVAKANELLGITPSSGDSLRAQLDTALAAVI